MIDTVTAAQVADTARGYSRTYLLICEGACNPTLREVDLIILAYRNLTIGFRANVRLARLGFNDFSDMVGLQRSLRHTEHVTLPGDRRAMCLTCGKQRQYGGN